MSWQKRAACAGQPLNLFFPGRGEAHKTKQAKAICMTCCVKDKCLDFTLENEDPTARHGIYGGMTQTERDEEFGTVPHDMAS